MYDMYGISVPTLLLNLTFQLQTGIKIKDEGAKGRKGAGGGKVQRKFVGKEKGPSLDSPAHISCIPYHPNSDFLANQKCATK